MSRTAVTTACGCGLSSGRSTRPRTTISVPPPAWLTEAVGSASSAGRASAERRGTSQTIPQASRDTAPASQ